MQTKHLGVKSALFSAVFIWPLTSLADTFPITVENNSGSKLILLNPGTGPNFQTITLCPKGNVQPGCPASIQLQLSNNSTPAGSTAWNYQSDIPSDYYINAQSNAGTPCGSNTGVNACYCLVNQGTADKYGGIKTPSNIGGQTITLNPPSSGQQFGVCSVKQAKPPSASTAPYQVIQTNHNYFFADSINRNAPLASLAPYFAAQGVVIDNNTSVTIQNDSPIAALLSTVDGKDYYGKIYVNKNSLSLDDYDNIVKQIKSGSNSACTTNYALPGIKGVDPHKIKCDVTFSAGNATVTMPVILNAGIRHLPVAEIMEKSIGPNPQTNLLNYLIEISAKPSDFTPDNNNKYGRCKTTDGQGNKIDGISLVGPSIYFNLGKYSSKLTQKPAGTIQYSLDASNVAPSTTTSSADAVRYIGTVNAFAYGNTEPTSFNTDNQFYINKAQDIDAYELCFDTSKEIKPGIYQINIKAQGINTTKSNDPGEIAYTTFYLNVNDTNPSHDCWIYKGKKEHCSSSDNQYGIAHTNLFNHSYGGNNPSPMIGAYTYSSYDATKSLPNMINTYKGYAKDIKDINSQYGSNSSKQINTMLAEIMDLTYLDTNTGLPLGFWPANPDGSLNTSAIGINEPDTSTWLPQLSEGIHSSGGKVGLTINYAFANPVRADFETYNEQQRNLSSSLLVQQATLIGKGKANDGISPVDGITLDLEGGYSSPKAAEFYKSVADKLAYQGKWFGLYYFSDMFTPSVIASFGPLGQALISGYDVASYRSIFSPDDQSKFYSGWNSNDIANYKKVYYKNQSCFTLKNNHTVSWCNANLNDTAAENYRLWTSVFEGTIWGDCQKTPGLCTPQGAFDAVNGKYQLVVPVSWSATAWSYVELFNPDLSVYTATPVQAKAPYCPGFKTSDPKPTTDYCPPVMQGNIMANSSSSASLQTGSSANPSADISANNQCSVINNDWLKSNDKALDSKPSFDSKGNPTNPSAQLSACLFNNISIGANKTPIQKYRRCDDSGTLPYSKCILVSSLAGSVPGSTDIINGTQSQYLQSIAGVYNLSSPNYVGTSMYAFDNFEAASNNGSFLCQDTINASAIQQPWYVGSGNALRPGKPGCDVSKGEVPYDPFYGTKEFKSIVDQSWQQYFNLLSKSGSQ